MVSTLTWSGINQHMNLRRLILLVGAVALVVGVVGLLVPVSVPTGQRQHRLRQRLGSGFVGGAAGGQQQPGQPADTQPDHPHTNYTAQCHSAVSGRRAWTIPVTIVGLVAIAGSFFVGGRAGARTL
jgi:hypothetical protein